MEAYFPHMGAHFGHGGQVEFEIFHPESWTNRDKEKEAVEMAHSHLAP